MGRYEDALWESDPQAPSRRDRTGGTYHPYVPDMLAHAELRLSMDAAQSCESAALALADLDSRARYVTVAESLSHVLLRSEALSSSRIEGLEMNVRQILEVEALEELGVPHRLDSAEAEVLGNINAMREAIGNGVRDDAFALGDILSIHAELLRKTRLAEYGGVLRTTQNWIGGSWYNPLGARYVPPMPRRVGPLMDDLVSFINTSRLPVVATAALSHAQIETIHPFVDGNGRVGRALVHAVLRRGGLATRTVAPISLVLLTLREQYYHALEAYRFDAASQESHSFSDAASSWIEFFCNATVRACQQALLFDESMVDLRKSWEERVRPRSGSSAQLLLDALPGSPVVSIASVARLTGRSYPSARAAVRTLEDAGILYQSSKNRKSGLYAAKEVLDKFTLYERSLASPSGNTLMELPVRHVPQRPLR